MSRTPEQIADSVAKVKSHFDRIGGLYEMALKGAQAGLAEQAEAPGFRPEGVHDYYRAQWQRINRAHDVDPQPCELKITSDVSEGQIGHTNWMRISPDQARRILAMLSTESETN